MKNIAILFALAIGAVSCNVGEECDDCNAALQHMRDKIESQGCNPSFMSEAVQRIKDECGNDANNQIGYMAETCYLGNTATARCKGATVVLDFELNLAYVAGPANDTVVLIMNKVDGQDQFQFDMPLNSSWTQEIKLPIEGYQKLQFRLQAKDTALTLIDVEQEFRFDRINEWDETRGIIVSHTPANGYQIDFEYW